ncbi:MAG: bifunctional phosphopantothenoylcysteine decarboxylase/phosphopantothenate--cysteine ligase CoaBC [Chloroflexi bacterium]|nr:bifunctional phosphopantothenoylcysteine decarboxylase/phosphopantothenate--cysteine ligase CoaBC [Chloroflexota bacterium]
MTTTSPFSGKNILLGVTGSIACYKAADLASKLTQAGVKVQTILTPSAEKFISPLTFQSVTGQRAFVDKDLWGNEGHIQHIGLGLGADLLLIAPCSANTIAKIAHGIADTLLTLTALAARCPIMIAPAMDGGMFSNPATQENLDILRKRGFIIMGPIEGRMASGMIGLGRMMEVTDLYNHIRLALSQNGPLSNRHFIITAGGTQEPLDPVRVLSNRSSGKQGYALAQAALDQGARVTLISAPANLPIPAGAVIFNVNTAKEMLQAVLSAIPGSDALIMAAAVADFQPIRSARQKIKKDQGLPEIKFEYTPDILEKVADFKAKTGFPRVVVGFAAESQDLVKNAQQKMINKHLDIIVANDITSPLSGFTADTNQVTIIESTGVLEELPLLSKYEVAQTIIEKIKQRLSQ